MDAIIIASVALAALVGYRLGFRSGMREGASRAQKSLLNGATTDLSETEQNLIAAQFRAINSVQPSSSMRNIDEFSKRSIELGRIVAQANRNAGAAHQQRISSRGEK